LPHLEFSAIFDLIIISCVNTDTFILNFDRAFPMVKHMLPMTAPSSAGSTPGRHARGRQT